DGCYMSSMVSSGSNTVLASFATERGYGYGVYRSEDDGSTFIRCGNGIYNAACVLSMSSISSGRVFAWSYATRDAGTFETDDFGKSWRGDPAVGGNGIECIAPNGYAYSFNRNGGLQLYKSIKPVR